MAIGTPTAVGQATRTTGSANLVTGTITFTADSVFYVFGFCRNNGASTFSNSQTLSMTAILDDGTNRLYAQSFTGDGSSGTVLFNGGGGPAVLQVIEVTGCDEAVVQSAVGNAWGGGGNNASVTLPSTPASTAVSIAAVGFDSGTFTADDTEIQQDVVGGDGLGTQFTTGTDDTLSWSHGGTTKSTIGFELAEAAAGGITGSGALASQSATMSGTALIEKTSSGVLLSQDATMSGTGTVSAPAITGSGALVSQDAVMSGTGTVSAPPITGSGVLASQAATMAGTGTVIVPTLDDVNTNEITVDGETGVTYAVTGFSTINGIKIKSGTAETDATGITASDFDIPNVSAYTIDTDGAPFTTASNAIVYEVTDGVAVASLAGTHNPILGWLVQEITGAVKTPGSVFENFIGTIPDTSEVYYPNADNTTVDATGILSTDSTSNIDMQYWDATLENWQPFSILISISGSGALVSQAATMSGAGSVGSNIVGSGSLVSQSATMTGAGLIEKTSSGVLISQAATMSGTGVVGDDIVGNGVLLSQSATMSGAGIRELTSSGNLISQVATMSGVGARGLKSSGNLLSQSATMTGEGTIPQAINGSGVLISQVATMSGQGDVPRDVTVKPQNTNTAGIRQNNTTRVGPRQPNTVRTFPK